jgi:hypothetical protein
MAVAQGYGKTVTSGSVFAYDVADSRNSYKGEPTVNVISNADTMAGWTNYYQTITSSTFTTEFGTTGYRFVNQPTWNGIYRNFNLGSSGFYTFSAWFKYNGGSAANNGATVYISNYGGGDTLAALDKTKVGIWQRVTFTVNVTSPSNVYFFLISYGGVNNGTGDPDFSSWEVTMPQIELNSHATPFVAGIRSVTQGLLPLVSKSEISLALTSFDSDAQISLDGSGDFIRIDQDGNYFQPSFTWETVVKFTSIQNTYQGLIWAEGSTIGGAYSGEQYLLTLYNNEYFHYRIQNATTGWTNTDTSTIDFNPQLYNHIVWQFSNGTTKIYINGKLFHTDTSRGAYNGGKFSPFFLGARNDGAYSSAIKMPVARLYNRILSADEVKQNFDFYDARFGIEVDPYYFVVSNRFSRSLWFSSGYTKVIADTTPAYILYQKPDASNTSRINYTEVVRDSVGSPAKYNVFSNQYAYGSGRFFTTVNAYRSKKGNRLNFTFPDGRTSSYGEDFYKSIVTPYVP